MFISTARLLDLARLKIFNVLIIYLVIAFPIHCNLQNINDVYGLYDGVEHSFKHLSPFHGFIFIEKDITKHYYEYGPENDPITFLVKALFKLDGDTFKATTGRGQIGTYLDSEAIGQILAAIETDKNEVARHVSQLQKKFKEIVESNVKKSFKPNPGQLRRAFGSIGKFKSQVNKFCENIVNVLTVSSPNAKEKIHSQHLMHFILLSFLYAKIQAKNDLKPYFEQFKNLNDGKGILKADFPIWDKSYNPFEQVSIYDNFEKQEEKKMWDYAIKNYESMGFALIVLDKYGGAYPRQLNYKSVLPEWFKASTRQYAYSDCMETAIRNLLNFACYNINKFILPDLIEKNSAGALFYKDVEVTAISGQKAHDKWSTIVSDIPGVSYCRRAKLENGEINVEIFQNSIERPNETDGWYYYELKPNLTNIWKVCNHIFNLKLKNFQEFLEAFELKCADEIKEESTNVTLQIVNKNNKDCTLSINPNHGEVRGFETSEMSIDAIQEILQTKFLKDSSMILTFAINLYGFNINSYVFRYDYLFSEFKGQLIFESNIITNCNLEDNHTKMQVVKFILKEEQNRPQLEWYKSFMKNLVNALLKLNDEYTTIETLRTLVSHVSSDELINWMKSVIEEELKNENNVNAILELLVSELHDGGPLSQPSLCSWSEELIKQYFLKTQFPNKLIENLIFLKKIDLIVCLLEKATSIMLYKIFKPLALILIEILDIETFKRLIARLSEDDMAKILNYYLINLDRIEFGIDALKNLIDETIYKLELKHQKVLLRDLTKHKGSFDVNWLRNLINKSKLSEDKKIKLIG